MSLWLKRLRTALTVLHIAATLIAGGALRLPRRRGHR